jgi:hypothetical protein
MSSISRWQVKLALTLFWCVTLFTPLVISSTVLSYSSGEGWTIDPMYMFIFGAYAPHGSSSLSGWFIGPMYLSVIFMALFFFIVFAALVTKYCFKPTTQRWAIAAGIISLANPIFLIGPMNPIDALLNGIYLGPLPFQFILGLIVMWIVKSGLEVPEDKMLEEKPSWWGEKQDKSLSRE